MKNIEIVTYGDKAFPNALRQIPNPPQRIYVEGDVSLLQTLSISIIGSRKCLTESGMQAKKLAYDLACRRITIVSGMALGIDTLAHLGALETNEKTIAVLGCGFNHIFPKENIWLYRKILENGGAVISEYPPDTYPCSKRFLERNRIISGISKGTIVVEATYRSGSSATARLAKKQGRVVFGTENSINNIPEGAILINAAKDVIDYLKIG